MSVLLERFDRAFGTMSIEEILTNRRAIIGPANMPTDEQGRLAKAALLELENGRTPAPAQLMALELVVRLMRPSLLSTNRNIEDLPQEAAGLGDWDGFRVKVRPSLYSIGRVDDASERGFGTGFLVSENLLVTNIHVVDELTGGLRVLARGQAKVWFKKEFRAVPEEDAVDILKVVALHDTLDLALLEVAPVALDENRTLLKRGDKANGGDAVVVIGYPQNDPARNPLFIPAVFDGRFGVKRVAPGEVISTSNNSLFHDCSTLGGNSGSPILSLKTGRIVGVHRAGSFMFRNESVAGEALDAFLESHL